MDRPKLKEIHEASSKIKLHHSFNVSLAEGKGHFLKGGEIVKSSTNGDRSQGFMLYLMCLVLK